MGPPSYMLSVFDRNVVMWRIPVNGFQVRSFKKMVQFLFSKRLSTTTPVLYHGPCCVWLNSLNTQRCY